MKTAIVQLLRIRQWIPATKAVDRLLALVTGCSKIFKFCTLNIIIHMINILCVKAICGLY